MTQTNVTLLKCYRLLNDCILFEHIQQHPYYICNNLQEIRNYKNELPSDTYKKIDKFIHTTIHPIVFSPNYFDFTKNEKTGIYHDDGSFEITSEDALDMLIYLLASHCQELKEKVDEFALEHLSIKYAQLTP